MSRLTHYEWLGVHRSSTQEEVKDAWKAKASKLHPDRNVGLNEQEQKARADSFAMASQAWAVLGDVKRRAAYDKEVALLRPVCEPCKGKGCTYEQKSIRVRVAHICGACNGVGRSDKRVRKT